MEERGEGGRLGRRKRRGESGRNDMIDPAGGQQPNYKGKV